MKKGKMIPHTEISTTKFEYADAITAIGQNYMKLEDSINLALKLGRARGLTDLQIGDDIRAELKNVGRSRMNVSRYLPATAKHMEKARPKLQSGNRMLPNKAVVVSTDNKDNSSPPKQQLEQKQQEEGRPGKWNQDPLEYKIEEVRERQYDIDYLCRVVEALHELRKGFIQESFKWQTKYDDMQREIRALKEENARFKATGGERKIKTGTTTTKSHNPPTTENDKRWSDMTAKNISRYMSKFG